MEKAFRALLTSSAAVTALVPASAIAFGVVPQGTKLPAVALHVISNRDGLTYKGPDGLWQGIVQVDCYGADYGATVTLADTITALLSGYRGGSFQGIFLNARRDTYDPAATPRAHRVSLDFATKWRPQ